LYILPYTIWFLEAVMVPEFFSKLDNAQLYVQYVHSMSFFLGCLALLHYWWFFLISEMLATIIFKGQLIDIQQTVQGSPDKRKKKTN
jgi:hypothetical protein